MKIKQLIGEILAEAPKKIKMQSDWSEVDDVYAISSNGKSYVRLKLPTKDAIAKIIKAVSECNRDYKKWIAKYGEEKGGKAVIRLGGFGNVLFVLYLYDANGKKILIRNLPGDLWPAVETMINLIRTRFKPDFGMFPFKIVFDKAVYKNGKFMPNTVSAHGQPRENFAGMPYKNMSIEKVFKGHYGYDGREYVLMRYNMQAPSAKDTLLYHDNYREVRRVVDTFYYKYNENGKPYPLSPKFNEWLNNQGKMSTAIEVIEKKEPKTKEKDFIKVKGKGDGVYYVFTVKDSDDSKFNIGEFIQIQGEVPSDRSWLKNSTVQLFNVSIVDTEETPDAELEEMGDEYEVEVPKGE